ncbi:iron-siderophore ABC transporter substrate-binding protein [Leptolyngbya cf. ectocarpi LEGE 11479]|uniref:Iron-siderophore ABC transporter substrate-binding protein n=1 Tax=Leptolyngbya cf. ectocarpi LEGE 11479 TaxID=1828722 RepID=A0A928ZVT6_LEPEC|nr:iron-siderophore ABC transporter substrate-binding protein [Leptolyngbya ectocarpi]MBE9068371.1 iron-siderophore ABC transporter substrate-binding protein [Leptolyngbya cf. ectocarpi LEGE 11479]
MPVFKRVLFAIATLILVVACGTPSPTTQPVIPEQGHIVSTALGDVVVPQSPQRVVVLSQNALDNTLALGVTPIASTYSGFPHRSNYGSFADYLTDKTEGVDNIGHSSQPNLEAILSLKPDLILSNVEDHRTFYDLLSQIAPTVLVETRADALATYAAALGKPEQGEALIQDFQARIQDFRQQIGDRLQTTEVSVLRFRPDQVRLYMQNSFCGYILEQVGLPRPPSQAKAKFYETVSLEAIPAMDGDVIFYFQDNPQNSMAQKVTGHPLWQQLEAVQQEQVYPVSFDTWFLGNGILAANALLDDLFNYLIDTPER